MTYLLRLESQLRRRGIHVTHDFEKPVCCVQLGENSCSAERDYVASQLAESLLRDRKLEELQN